MSSATAGGDVPPEDSGQPDAPRTVVLRAPAPVSEVRRLVDDHRLHPVMAATLWARGVRDDPRTYLDPPLQRAAIPAFAEAVDRLLAAMSRSERILVHGDYDADGVSATALLTLALRALGGTVTPYVPDRLSDGYGIHPQRVDAHAAGADLVVTVDCGIGNVAEIAALRAAGTDVIVTDHHLAGAKRPDAIVVHPDDGVGSHGLTGAGIAYHLVWALHERLGVEAPVRFADIAAIGTIADVAPLVGPNRALVRAGLEQLRDPERPGVRALLALSKLRPPLRAHHVAFVVAPRLNAAGRMGHADQALELLLTGDERRARVLATLLEGLNDERRRVQQTMLEQALELADGDGGPALVLHHPAWHAGVMGIVASQLVERVHKPVFVIADGKGSVRSLPGVSAVEALEAASTHLRRWGGHAAAAGFSIDVERIDDFRNAVCRHLNAVDVRTSALTVDALLHPAEVDADLHAALEALEPYGEGHPEPLFAVPGRLDQVASMGAGRNHLQVSQGGVRGVGWGLGHLSERWRVGQPGLSVGTLSANTWRERTSIELRVKALAAPTSLRLDAPQPSSAAGPGTVRVRVGPGRPGDVVIRRIEPLHDDPLAPLPSVLADGASVALDLGADGPTALRRLATEYPRVSDARHAFVYRSRGRTWPWDGPLAARLEAVLRELDLVDDRGRARAGRQVDPYASTTLRQALVTRHALEQLATLLEALPADQAGAAIEALVSAPAARRAS